ncbi:MAG TPA: hypothetical protein VNE63_11335 [Candidatus Acidoferrales bacterium]|nr:hypothetical protein [Candidatus Acidoferrales bacterium]
MDSAANQIDPKELAHQREQAREYRTAAWILILTMTISTILAMGIFLLIQRP